MTANILEEVTDRFKAHATLLVPLAVLNETSTRLGTLINSAILGVGVSDPENRSKIVLHFLPGIPGPINDVADKQISFMERSRQIQPETSAILRNALRDLRSKIDAEEDRYYFASALGYYDIERTLSINLKHGEIHCLMRLSAQEDGMPRYLSFSNLNLVIIFPAVAQRNFIFSMLHFIGCISIELISRNNISYC